MHQCDVMDGTLLETCWRVRGRSGCIFSCSLYRIELGTLELRIEHHEQEVRTIVLSQAVAQISSARDLAALWRETVLKGHFVELLH